MRKGKEASEGEMMSWPLNCVGIGGPHAGCCGLLREYWIPRKRRLGWSGCLLCLWLVVVREGGEWPLQWAGRFIGSWVGN